MLIGPVTVDACRPEQDDMGVAIPVFLMAMACKDERYDLIFR